MPLPPDLGTAIASLWEEVRKLRYLVNSAPMETQASTASDETITVAKNADSGWISLTSGPSVTVATRAGKIVVTVSGRVKIPVSNTGARAVISYEIRDSLSAQIVAPDINRGVGADFNGGTGSAEQSAYAWVHDGLAPGTYTVKTQYRYQDGAGATAGPFTADFINRAIIAKGY